MTWDARAVGRMIKDDEPQVRCRGIGCKVSWKCWRWSQPHRFRNVKPELIRDIQGIEECNGVHFGNDDTRVSFEGLINVSSS